MRMFVPAVILLTFGTLVRAEDTTADLPIGTIDMAYIFKNHKPVALKLAPLKATVHELEQKIQLRQVEIEQLQRKLTGATADERGRIQVQLAKLQTELRVFVEKERNTLQRQELQIQAGVYKEIQQEVKRIAKERGLKLVIVRPRGSLETEDPAELTRTLNQLVIYEDGLDLTDEVLKALEAKLPQDQAEDR